jgi:hypothetical protein
MCLPRIPERIQLLDITKIYQNTQFSMPTDLPYAADAEESLAYDELEVRVASVPFFASFLNIFTDDRS